MSDNQYLTDKELDHNYDAFKEALPELLVKHPGRYVIVRDAKVLDAYDTVRDAHLAGWRQFNDDRFSVQEVTDEPAYLGIFSHSADFRNS